MVKDFVCKNHGYLMKKRNKFSLFVSSNRFEDAEKELKKILFQLRGTSEQRSDANTIPGKYFSFHHPELAQNDVEAFYCVLISNIEFVEKHENIIAQVIAQLAAYDFVYFVQNIIPIFSAVDDPRLQNLYASVCRIICDPPTGFLRNAPLNEHNKMPEWDDNTIFDFFTNGSPFLKTDFGLALIQLRNTVTKIIKDLCKNSDFEIKFSKIPKFYVQSFMLSVQTIIVPPKFREFQLACGFPGRIEMLLALSSFQDRAQFQKVGGYSYPSYEIVVDAWQKYYTQISGFPSFSMNKSVDPVQIEDTSKNLLFRFLKLSLLTCLELSSFPFKNVGDFIMSKLLGYDNQNMPFMIPWCQALISLHKAAAKDILDSICKVFEKYRILSSSQQYMLFHMVARFLDIYVCSDERSLSTEQMLTIVVYAIIGLCSNHPTVRFVAMKVMVSIGRFKKDDNFTMFDEFIKIQSKPIIMNFLSFLDRQPATILQTCPQKPYLLLNFELLVESTNQTLWQLYLAAIALEAARFYSPDLLKRIIIQLQNFIDSFNENVNSMKILLVNVLTILASFTDNPKLDHIDKLLDYIIQSSSQKPTSYLLIFAGLSHRCFSKLVIKLLESNYDCRLTSYMLSSICWSKGFTEACHEPSFIKIFTQAFKYSAKLVMDLVIDNENVLKSSRITEDQVMLFCSTSYRLFLNIMEKFSDTKVTSFPSMRFVMDTNIPEVKEIVNFFDPIFNIAQKYTGNTRLFAIHALNMWFLCCKHPDETKVSSIPFLDEIWSFTDGVPNIFSGLLSHHFEVLFPLFLKYSVDTEKGEAYFKAICDFFRPKMKNSVIEFDEMLYDHIWKCCKPIKKDKSLKYLQVIYENWGSLILVSIHYMARPQRALTDDAFILLATLTPVIYLFRMKGRIDELQNIFDFFLHTCRQFSTLTLIDDPAILALSKKMRDLFPFVLEQVLFDLMEIIRNPEILRSTLKYFIPWFNLVLFDYENRVISRETELRFMRFSCFSFVDKVFSTVKHVSSDNPNAANNDIWRALCVHVSKGDKKPFLVEDNIRGIIYAIKEFNDTVVHVLRYIYTISDQHVLDYITSFLSYEYAFYRNYRDPPIFYEASSSYFDFSYIDDKAQMLAPLKVLTMLSEDAIKPIFKYLPKILSYCVIFKYLYPEETTKLVNTIFTSIKPHVADRTLQIADDIISRFSLLMDKTFSNFNEPFAPNMIKPKQISLYLWKFLKTQFGHSSGQEFSLNCLKWGLCHSDLSISSIALKCFQGAIDYDENEEVYDSAIVGIFARVLANISHCLDHLLNVKKDLDSSKIPVFYFRTILKTLKVIAEKMHKKNILVADSGIFWIAIESLKCNTSWLTDIFDAGLSVLEFFFKHPTLFECISDQHHYNGTQFTINTFWKFHKPWGDRFAGCYKYILGFSGEIKNPDRFFQFLNLMVQLRCPALFSSSPKWMYTALLSLLPWMWSVVITDISRFLTKTPKVLMMQKSLQDLSSYIEKDDETIVKFLEKAFAVTAMSITDDMFTMVTKLVELIIDKIDKSDIPIICNFFTNCLESGSRSLIVPLYSIATAIIRLTNKDEDVFKALSKFYFIADEQEKNDPDITIYTQLFKDEMTEYISDYSSSSSNVSEELFYFPEFHFFDRIIAILVPRLHEIDLHDSKPQTFATIQQFPQMNPNIAALSDCKRFVELTDNLKQIPVSPFSQTAELCTKMRSTFIDTDALKMMRETEKVDMIAIDKIMKDVLKIVIDDNKSMQGDIVRNTNEEEEEQQEHQENREENNFNLELCTFPASIYLPDMAYINELDRSFFAAEEEMEPDQYY
ncbi:hypothetical protein TVAG_170440 [Trichomonas vaginalis G3]|uniref:Uncharacterized protein n=1 Tax=Trichomonas vaginalis (strain ATCC PRA-98 / G3) TaxID=412133 RepID=A2DPI6_TRIV3|nr:hypothetical protein TVAGG3_0680420 [Trichomonas vaginalis G3]EAY17730.1 hypothetical protein TVAG_170440 [Trichomonas vaginalis G3]KAI5507866.1 hypothetical protein TVAGG3_0680420 [Trichomonas vaginalis G3]|eukprot:XP_001329865.1 hypothetical protein [Trichomonas vaginalis G3]